MLEFAINLQFENSLLDFWCISYNLLKIFRNILDRSLIVYRFDKIFNVVMINLFLPYLKVIVKWILGHLITHELENYTFYVHCIHFIVRNQASNHMPVNNVFPWRALTKLNQNHVGITSIGVLSYTSSRSSLFNFSK